MADYTIMVMGEALSHALQRAAPRARLHIRLVRESLATEYADGIRFVDAVALVAEAQEHHPDIHVVWTTVTLKIQTHDEGGLTEWDIDLAKAIEKDVSSAKKRSGASKR